ncbi:MAG: MurR/RpiR family transcriptional regulator [Turicibacter sp.]|nr:MurR/RpiR family transcriptional regulator [Turicibacter sp.]
MGSGILNEIELAVPELPFSEQKVARYILAHPQDVLYTTISELSAKSESSSAAVVRFCKSVGVGNFGSLKVRLSAELGQAESGGVGYMDIEDRESVASVVKKTLSNTTQTLENTAYQLDQGAVRQVVKMLQEAETIYVYGVGASFLIAEDVAQKWRRLGKMVYAMPDYHLLMSTMAARSDKAVFFAVSYSGQTREVLQLVDKAKALGMKTIGLSRIGSHKLSGRVDVLLSTARAPEAKLRSAATSSRFAQLFVIDIVFLAYASAQYEFTVRQLEKSKQAVQDLG